MQIAFSELKPTIEWMWEKANILPAHLEEVQKAVAHIKANQARYELVAHKTAVPWAFIGCLHYRESDLDFSTHLHNGDSLRRRTFHVPAGRPPWLPSSDNGYTWEESAIDAIHCDELDQWHDWSIPGCLYKAEAYNGFGSRGHGIPCPYVWSFTNQYVHGKYIADGKFDANAIDRQAGVASLLKLLS